MEYENINNSDDLRELMQELGKDGKVRTCQVVFSRAYVKEYRWPSQVNYADVGDCNIGCVGYWKDGELHKFGEKTETEYKNSCYSNN